MKNFAKRKSIFNILISRIFLFLILFNIIVTIYIIQDEIKTENNFKEIKSRELITEVKDMLIFINTNIKSLEQIYGNKQKKIVNQFEKLLKISNNNINQQFINNLNSDTSLHHILIIKDGIIVNSSNSDENGRRIYSFLNPDDSIFFQDQITKGTEFPAKFIFDKKKLNFRILGFYPVLQNKYIVGLNSASPEFDYIKELFKFRLHEMAKENKTVLSINFWMHLDNQRIPMLEDSYNSLVIERINGPALKEDSVFLKIKLNGRIIGIKHVYQESRKTIYNSKGTSISIVTDFTNETKPFLIIVRNRIVLLLISLFLFFVIIYFATKNLKLTLADLLEKTAQIGEGSLNKRVEVFGNNEFTTLSEHFNNMVEKIEIAHNELKQKNEEILAQRDEILAQRDEIELQRNLAIQQRDVIEQQKINILDSINYAQKIQEAVLPEMEYIKHVLPKSFVYYKPCSVVSGDFYWIKEKRKELIIIVADCTGHGVPGAFMSMLGSALLNEIVLRDHITQPNLILNHLREKIKYALKQSGKDNEAQDGMDIAVCTIKKDNGLVQFAGAMNPLILIRNSELIKYEADPMPAGIYLAEKENFTLHEFEFEDNDTIYMYSDGYEDQIGGPKDKKLMSKNFENFILEISKQAIENQINSLDDFFKAWKKDRKQTDDVLVMGFKIQKT